MNGSGSPEAGEQPQQAEQDIQAVASTSKAVVASEEEAEEEQLANGHVAGPDDSEAESEEEDDVESEDEEPKLKYSRFKTQEDLLLKDAVSALAVSDKLVAIGTQNGCLLVLSLEGRVIKRSRLHAAYVFCVSIDNSSTFIATASLDGKVIVTSLGPEEDHEYGMQRPMRAVALDPDYGKHSTKEVITGGMSGHLVLHEKGWLGQKDVTLHAGEGPIWNISRRGSLIAWANDEGARVYDLRSSSMVGHFPRPEDSPRSDLFRCCFCWHADRLLTVAWADYISLVHIKERPRARTVPGVGYATQLYAEVSAIFQVDCMIAGITLFEDCFLILAYPTDDPDEQNEEDEDGSGPRLPELRLISKEGDEMSSDALRIPNYQRYQCHDYHLASLPLPPATSSQQSRFFVASPKDLITAQPRDAADHVMWLIEHEQYYEALRAVDEAGLSNKEGFDRFDLGLKYLYHLFNKGEYTKAAQASPEILGQRHKEWEDWAFAFIERGQIEAIYPVVPTYKPQLSRLVYELILAHLVRHDVNLLLHTLRIWPRTIYDSATIISAIQNAMEKDKANEGLLIKALLENAGTEIQPVSLIKRIRNGLEIPGLRDALVKILQDINLQVTLMEGCQDILQNDCRFLSERLMSGQKRAFYGGSNSTCAGCGKAVFEAGLSSTAPTSKSVALLFLCRHVFHAGCAFPSTEANLPSRSDKNMGGKMLNPLDTASHAEASAMDRQFRSHMQFTAELRGRLKAICPLCAESH